MDKRQFLKGVVGLSMSSPLFKNISKWTAEIAHLSPIEVAKDEDFWARIRSGYRLKSEYINLENGYYCFVPQETLEHFIHHARRVNYEGSWYMRTVQGQNKDHMATLLADVMHAGHDEVVVTRNTTESLDIVISGYDWKPGDEAVYAVHDYGAMRNQFKFMAHRFGMVNKVVQVPIHPKSDAEIVETYEKAITDKTRLLMICHLINITGHILPVRKICDMAHARGVDVMVDGAHAFGHIVFDINDLGCDYYGSSLHKWMSVPLGAGLLYVKKGKAKDIWPVFASWSGDPGNIKNLNHTGTHPVHTDLAIANAVEYYNLIGAERKEARLRYLQNYWTDQVREYPGIQVNTPTDRHRSCAIANVGIKGMEPAEMAQRLLKEHRIWTVAINESGVQGCRITPNVYTTTKELDQFVIALKTLAG
ncbi:MAG: aminotransferase class V-fold PLP-dependent enzyme [Bacteroidia bacterium]|nr:aminotransferase class V-fold PLP-dependent enzyme [Bacteroidia bacterium]